MKNKMAKVAFLIPLLFTSSMSHAFTSKIRLTRECELFTTLNINGKTFERLVIDTGATGGIHLKKNDIHSLSGNPAKYVENQKSYDAFGTIREVNHYMASHLTINGKRINNVPLSEYKMWGNGYERQHIEPIYGVVGLDSFGDNAWLIDFKNMKFEVAPHFDLKKEDQWEEIPIRITEYGIELDAIGEKGKRLKMILDTGTNGSFVFPKNAEEKTSVTTEVVVGENQVVRVMRHYFAPGLAMDGIDGLIGCDYLKGKRLIITKNVIYITHR